MALRNILTAPNPDLLRKSKPTGELTSRIRELVDDLIETMKASEGIGLAAPQVGILRRIAVIDGGRDRIVVLIDPEIVYTEGEQEITESCLSVPSRSGKVLRPEFIKVKARNKDGQWKIYSGRGLFARAVCHELDHLDGVLFTDKMTEEIFPEQQEQDEE